MKVRFREFQVGTTAEGLHAVYGLDRSGRLWIRARNNTGAISDWTPLPPPEVPNPWTRFWRRVRILWGLIRHGVPATSPATPAPPAGPPKPTGHLPP